MLPRDPLVQSLVRPGLLVVLEDVEEKPDDEGGGKRLRQGTSAERICSVHDPEMVWMRR